MARLDVRLTGLDQLQRLQEFINPKLFERAQKGGLAYASKAVPLAVRKGITASYNITSGRVNQDISSVRFAGDGLSASIRFSRRPPTLTQFKPNLGRRSPQPGLGRGLGWGKPKRPGRPVTATILKANGRKEFPGVFITTGLNGNRIALRRTSSGRLVGVYGPSTGSIFLGNSAEGEQLRSDVQARIMEQYIKGFQRVLDSAARGYLR